MSAHIYIEGGESKEQQIRCREGFRKLLEKAGFSGKLPRLSACGGRTFAYNDFKTAHSNKKTGDYVAMLVDSEDPVQDTEAPWNHLGQRDHWERPQGALDEQVLLMTTSMETWIAADRAALRELYGAHLQENALPPLQDLEDRRRNDVFDNLVHATRNCKNAYMKGKRSFELLAKLDPIVLKQYLPSFVRAHRILDEKL